MTNCIIALSLVLTPAPVTARQETHLAWQTLRPSVLIAEPSVTTSLASLDISVSFTEPFGVEIEEPAPIALPVPDIPPPAPPTLQEIVLAKLPPIFLQIVKCESSWNPDVVGPFKERGLGQIHPVHARPGGAIERAGWTWADMFNPVANVDVMAVLYQESGLTPWAASRRCWG